MCPKCERLNYSNVRWRGMRQRQCYLFVLVIVLRPDQNSDELKRNDFGRKNLAEKEKLRQITRWKTKIFNPNRISKIFSETPSVDRVRTTCFNWDRLSVKRTRVFECRPNTCFGLFSDPTDPSRVRPTCVSRARLRSLLLTQHIIYVLCVCAHGPRAPEPLTVHDSQACTRYIHENVTYTYVYICIPFLYRVISFSW